jgi:hypothetical protein
MKPCDHDYMNAVHVARFLYICPRCGADITLGIVLLEEAKQ